MTLAETHQIVADHCAEIAKLFKPGAKVTVIVRNPGFAKEDPHSADMLIGDDDWFRCKLNRRWQTRSWETNTFRRKTAPGSGKTSMCIRCFARSWTAGQCRHT